MSDTVVAIVGIFFIIGILVGIVTVVAAAVLRADRRNHQDDPDDLPASRARRTAGPGLGRPWLRPAPALAGDTGNDFSDR